MIDLQTATTDLLSWGETQFIPIKTLYEKKETLLSGNMLRLRIEEDIIKDVTHQFSKTKPLPTDTEVVPELTSPPPVAWLKDLWKTKKHSDLSIVCGETTFSAHKCIMSGKCIARSSQNNKHLNLI